jgi:hypothetical protein
MVCVNRPLFWKESLLVGRLNTRLHILPKLRMSGDVTPLPYAFMTCTTQLYFTSRFMPSVFKFKSSVDPLLVTDTCGSRLFFRFCKSIMLPSL